MEQIDYWTSEESKLWTCIPGRICGGAEFMRQAAAEVKRWQNTAADSQEESERMRSALQIIAAQWSEVPGSTARADCMAVTARQALRVTDIEPTNHQ